MINQSTQNDEWWNLCQSTQEKGSEKKRNSLFAAWPILTYIEGFENTIGMMITYSIAKNWETSKWLQQNENTDESSEHTSKQKHIIKREIRFKIDCRRKYFRILKTKELVSRKVGMLGRVKVKSPMKDSGNPSFCRAPKTIVDSAQQDSGAKVNY